MNFKISINFFGIFITLTIMGCLDHSNNAVVFQQPKRNEIVLEADSVRFPPEMATFPIRIKLTNYSNSDAILTFKSVDNEFKHQKSNLYLVSGKDTLMLGINTNYIILDKHSSASLNIDGFYNPTDVKRKYFFNDIDSFPKGRIIYNVSEDMIKSRDNKDLVDTILIPRHLEVNIDNIKQVFHFSGNSFIKRVKSL